MSRVLIVGWFSFDEVVATVGDIAAAEVVASWLTAADIEHTTAWAPHARREPVLADVRPDDFSHLVWVCGPLLRAAIVDDLLDRFGHACRVAVGVSVVDPQVAARFDLVLARDGAGTGVSPDLAVSHPVAPTPVVATVFAPVQAEYLDRGRHLEVAQAVRGWVADRGLGWFDVATDALTDHGDQRSTDQVVATLGRADVVVTSRLHGMVLGLAAGRPVIALDPVVGGAKVTAQAGALGWPVVLAADEVSAVTLDAAFARAQAWPAEHGRPGPSAAAHATLDTVRAEVLDAVR